MTDSPTDADRLDPGPAPGYAEALDELEDILVQLESSTIDVDVLAQRVARGAELVRFCRGRLRTVRVEVDAVIDELLDDPAGIDGGNGTDG